MQVILLALFLLHFLNDGVRTAFITLLPFVAKDLHLSYTHVGFLASSQGFLTSMLAFPAGFFAGRIGGFKILFLSLLFYALGAIGIGMSGNAILLTIVFYIAAAGFGMFHTVGYSLVARVSEKAKIGQNMGNFTAIGDIGRILIPSSALFLVPILGWRNSFFLMGILGVLAFIILQLRLTKRQEFAKGDHNAPKQHYKEWIKQTALLLKDKKLLLIASAGILDNFAGNPIYVFLPFFLLAKHITPATLGIFTAIYFIGSFTGKFFLGRGVDKFGNAKIFILAEILMALSIFALTQISDFLLLLPIAYFLGLFTRGTTPVLSTLFSEITHEEHFEKVFAVSEVLMGITAAIAPTILGVVADAHGITSVFYVTAIFALLATTPILLYLKK